MDPSTAAYFVFVTLTTIGFGDITPEASYPGRQYETSPNKLPKKSKVNGAARDILTNDKASQTSHNIDCALGPLCYIRACSI
jgi:hypothetical protein